MDSTATRRRLTVDDTVKAPLASPYLPAVLGVGVVPVSFNREQLFASGALTLGELVAQLPGTTMMTTGFIMAPQVLAWHGDPRGVRLFVDGVEREEVMPRNAGVTDFTLVPLWALEHVTFETTPGELRVHARTWRVDRTTPSTRVDVLTGSENLNLFRGFFGKRFTNGLAIQMAAQQANTASATGMDGDGLGAMVRLGWASRGWSIDLTSLRQGVNRNAGIRYPRNAGILYPTRASQKDAFPPYNGSASMTYLRAGWRDPQANGPWIQIVAATLGAVKTHSTSSRTSSTMSADTADTTASRAQYAVSGGVNRAGIRLSGTAQFHSADGKFGAAPSVRAEWSRDWISVSANAGRRFEGARVWDVRGTIMPRDWLRLSGSVGLSPSGLDSGKATRRGQRVEAAVRWRDRWLSIGTVRLAGGLVSAPIELDTAMRSALVPDVTGITVNFTGPLLRDWYASTDIVNWNGAFAFRPQTQARSKIWFSSSFSDRFPRANFHLTAAFVHEYRSQFYAPVGGDPLSQIAKATSVMGSQLEIRIASAIISWTYRNIPGTYYETFPGYLMPRITSVYGIRWEFWN